MRSHARAIVALALFVACGCRSSTSEPAPCTTLFGQPSDQTGLDEATCRPSCGCGGDAWTPRPWTEARLAELRSYVLLDPPAELTSDPYDAPPAATAGVCAVRVVDATAKTYRLETFGSEDEANAAGALVTHWDGCGACSTLADLAVYAGINDLTGPVRQCGLDAGTDLAADVACLQQLGFTRPCAQIWAYNTQHTRKACLSPCIAALGQPYQADDGTLNACLLCDEEQSGPVFKAVAGRTRRNTGVPSALCRPCSEVHRIEHAYAP